ncbi:MAG TPA: BON domain-containing protein [Candidatus Bathyarchaeia archaeon]|nr:BON domain-containing protein [Candidatus Bathyarchaeia archaeon]
MRRRLLCFITLAIVVSMIAPAGEGQVSDRTTARIQKEVLHELTMLPFLTVFDNLAFKVEGDKVVLLGQVVNPVNKIDAEKAIKGIEGVEQVDNRIEVLPVSPMDDRLRRALLRAIYGFAPLQKYDMGVIKPIRIIVKNGHVTLEGIVDSQTDKDSAGLRANSVPGIFSVTNNLRVAKS